MFFWVTILWSRRVSQNSRPHQTKIHRYSWWTVYILDQWCVVWRTFLFGRWTRELHLSHSLSQCPRTVLVPHGSSSEAAVASQTLSKVLSFTVNPMINGISVSFNFRSTTDIEVGGGPLKPVWTNTPTGCFSLRVTHLGLELEWYDRGSRWTAPAWLLFSSLS